LNKNFGKSAKRKDVQTNCEERDFVTLFFQLKSLGEEC